MFHHVVDLVAHWPADLEGSGCMIRADTIRHSANHGKVERVRGFARRYSDSTAAIAASEWRTFIETGRMRGKYHNVSRFNAYCGAAPAQMAYARVRVVLGSFLANRWNDFRAMVTRSNLPTSTKHMLHTIRMVPLPGKCGGG